MSDEDAGFAHLDRAGRMTARLALSPRAGMTLAVGLATGLSFLLVLSLAARQAAVAPLAAGPGAALLAALPLPKLPAPLEGLASLCLGPSPSPAGVSRLSRTVGDVVPDGGGDDAAFGGADDPHLLRDRRYRGPARANRRSIRWLPGRRLSWRLACRVASVCAAVTMGCRRRRRRSRLTRMPGWPAPPRSLLPVFTSSAR